MKNIVIWFLWVFLIVMLSVFLLSTFFRYPNAPFGLHQWLPVPIACGGYSCITYRDLTIARKNDLTNKPTEVVLSAMMLDRVYRTVANFEKIRISEKEINQSRNAVTTTLKAIPGGENVMNEVYGKESQKVLTSDNFSFLLLKEKLFALGIDNPWKSKYAPKITVWNWWIKWDNDKKQFILR